MKKILLLGCGLVAITGSSFASSGINAGLKLGGNFAANAKYKDKAEFVTGSTVTVNAGKADFSGTKTGFGPSLEAFVNKDFYNNGSMFVNGELGLEIGGAKATIDGDFKGRLSSAAADKYINIKIKERFSGSLTANVGSNLSEAVSAYGKLGVSLASVNVKHEYEPDVSGDDIPADTNSKSVIMPGIIVGAGLNYRISESMFAILEGSYTIRFNKSLDDYSTDYIKTNNTLESKFTNRKVSINKAALKLGLGFAI